MGLRGAKKLHTRTRKKNFFLAINETLIVSDQITFSLGSVRMEMVSIHADFSLLLSLFSLTLLALVVGFYISDE